VPIRRAAIAEWEADLALYHAFQNHTHIRKKHRHYASASVGTQTAASIGTQTACMHDAVVCAPYLVLFAVFRHVLRVGGRPRLVPRLPKPHTHTHSQEAQTLLCVSIGWYTNGSIDWYTNGMHACMHACSSVRSVPCTLCCPSACSAGWRQTTPCATFAFAKITHTFARSLCDKWTGGSSGLISLPSFLMLVLWNGRLLNTGVSLARVRIWWSDKNLSMMSMALVRVCC
jgi:hypothetical protein